MKQLSILEVTIGFVDLKPDKVHDPLLIRLPYMDVDSLVEGVKYRESQGLDIFGVLAPYSEDNVEFNVRCASIMRDKLPGKLVYAGVPWFKTYHSLKTLLRAGFDRIAIPQYLGRTQYDHYFQFFQEQDLCKVYLHVAGGKFDAPTWNLEHWTWSEERL
jgi:hypothetical protein